MKIKNTDSNIIVSRILFDKSWTLGKEENFPMNFFFSFLLRSVNLICSLKMSDVDCERFNALLRIPFNDLVGIILNGDPRFLTHSALQSSLISGIMSQLESLSCPNTSQFVCSYLEIDDLKTMFPRLKLYGDRWIVKYLNILMARYFVDSEYNWINFNNFIGL